MINKSLKLNQKHNEKPLRIIFLLLTIAFVMAILACISVVLNLFVRDLYTAFILDSITMSFLYIAALTCCWLFLYLFFTITVFNPQRIKKSSTIKFAFGGIFTLIITLLLVYFGVTETTKVTQDMKDYSVGKWRVQDLLVMDVYRGGSSPIVLIDTKDGEMSLHRESFQIYAGQKYRFTYLDATNTIIKVEKLTD